MTRRRRTLRKRWLPLAALAAIFAPFADDLTRLVRFADNLSPLYDVWAEHQEAQAHERVRQEVLAFAAARQRYEAEQAARLREATAEGEIVFLRGAPQASPTLRDARPPGPPLRSALPDGRPQRSVAGIQAMFERAE